MRIDRATMLFVDLTAEEAHELKTFAQRVILMGTVPPLPWWYHAWMREFEFDEQNGLLMLSTAFVQRVLLSVTLFQDRQLELATDALRDINHRLRANTESIERMQKTFKEGTAALEAANKVIRSVSDGVGHGMSPKR